MQQTQTPRTRLSGCQRRRAKAIARRENVARLVERIEDRAFYENGTIPASATAVNMCSCGAQMFFRGELSEDDWNAQDEWHYTHADCGSEVSA
ncbi:MAG TPA: hypothetical protein VJL80_06300 [Aeromicrobium sp.]|nr:hypothetical protein [Aeromicrobium sp.]HKY57630.1 hypothetical protein [Aeromicrobium sp.]